jgi:hypothetical protein
VNEEEPQFEIVEDQPREIPRARPAKQYTSPDDDDEPRPKKEKPDRDDDDEPRRRKKKKRRRRAPPPPEYQNDYGGRGNSDLTALDLFLCIFCPGIGCIVGLIRLISGSGEGGKMVGLSLMFAVIWNVVRFALIAASK